MIASGTGLGADVVVVPLLEPAAERWRRQAVRG
ncbi:hypothetical protein JOD47_001124 [Arthrobacter tumbae]|nr:hypothetical protein [Arthrobacter tumbae]